MEGEMQEEFAAMENRLSLITELFFQPLLLCSSWDGSDDVGAERCSTGINDFVKFAQIKENVIEK